MHRIELYVDKNNKLIAHLYDEVSDIRPSRVLSGKGIDLIFSQIPEDLTYDEENMILTYSEYILNIHKYKTVFKAPEISPLISSINTYHNYKSVNALPRLKKVTRKNKYTNKKILVNFVAFMVLGVVAVSILIKLKGDTTVTPTDPIVASDGYEPETIPIDITEPTVSITHPTEAETLGVEITNPTEPETLPLEHDRSPITLDDSIKICISYEDRSDTDKAKQAEAKYGEYIEKYANMYGLDPRIVLAIATQERGVHSKVIDAGGATGLMQIQNEAWADQELSAYNYDTMKKETIIVKEERLADVSYNIKIGCMYFQNCMDYMDNNVLAAIQCYNMGYGNMKKILNEYSCDTGKTVKEILRDISDYGWLEYRDVVKAGDQCYLENVLSWMGPKINIDGLELDGTIVNLNISNENETKKCIN